MEISWASTSSLLGPKSLWSDGDPWLRLLTLTKELSKFHEKDEIFQYAK